MIEGRRKACAGVGSSMEGIYEIDARRSFGDYAFGCIDPAQEGTQPPPGIGRASFWVSACKLLEQRTDGKKLNADEASLRQRV